MITIHSSVYIRTLSHSMYHLYTYTNTLNIPYPEAITEALYASDI